MKTLRRNLSYSNVAATLALVFAMGGSAIAANHYLINSTKQINPKVLKKLKGNTGHSGLPGSQGPRGLVGPQGIQGTPGVKGDSGISGYEIVTGTPVKGSGAGADLATALAVCPTGKSPLGGGFTSSGPENFQLFVRVDGLYGTTGWFAQTTSATSTANYEISAYAICATVTS